METILLICLTVAVIVLTVIVEKTYTELRSLARSVWVISGKEVNATVYREVKGISWASSTTGHATGNRIHHPPFDDDPDPV